MKLIKKYGNTFDVVFSDDGFEPVVQFDDFSVSVSEGNYCITEVYIDSQKYTTSLGAKVGDNAKAVFDEYRQVYTSNEDGAVEPSSPKWMFDLGEDYVIQFWIDTDELTIDSVITKINIRHLYHGEV